MAWQLIYTSAPRLLEAGRSGFGTVARHRQIPALLVAAIERFSQFSRLPGLDTNRVIYAYRRITMSGGPFHVLSCIRDAGASFTGRTNHLAHHLIIEPREAAALGARGPSPADVLLAMPWRSQWTEAPQYLDAADEIAIASFPPQTSSAGAEWARVTGDSAHAALLTGSETSRGACIIAPPGCDLRPLFAESLRLAPERLWQIPFTTSLQPSDDAAEFRWLGIEATSPLRAQFAAQTTFDLTAPSSLPAPALPRAAAPQPFASNIGASSATAVPSAHRPTAFAPQAGANVPSNPFGEVNPSRPLPWKWIAVSSALLVLAVLGVFGWQLWQGRQKAEAERAAIIQIANDTGFFDPQKTGVQLANALRNADPAQSEKIRTLVLAAEAQTRSLNAPDFAALRSKPALATFQHLARDARIDLPAEMGALANLLDQAAAAEKWLRDYPAEPAREAQFRELKAKRKDLKFLASLESGLTQNQSKQFEKIRNDLDRLAAQQQAATLRHWIDEPWENLARFNAELAEIGIDDSDLDGTDDRKRLRDVRDAWRIAEEQSKEKIATYFATRSDLPRWLRKIAREKAAMPAEDTVAEKTTTQKIASKPASDTGAARVIWVTEKGKLAVTLPKPVANLRFLLKSGASTSKEITRFGETNRFGPQGSYFKIEGETLTPASAEPDPPYEITVQGEAATLMRIVVGLPVGDEPLLGRVSGALRFADKKVKVTVPLPTLIPAAVFHLVLKKGSTASKSTPEELALNEAGEGDLDAAAKSLADQIAAKRAQADAYAKQATQRTVGANSFDALRQSAKKYAEPLAESARKIFDQDAKSPGELVGTFAMAVADHLDGANKKRAFEDLGEKGKELADASAAKDEAKVKQRSKELRDKVLELEKRLRTGPAVPWFANVRSLSTNLNAMLGDGADAKAEIVRFHQLAEEAEKEAKRLEALPIRAGKLPPGDYTLVARLQDGTEVKVYLLTAP